MTTLMKEAKSGITTEEMKIVSEREDVPIDWLRQRIAKGTVIIPRNVHRENVRIVGIGEGLRTKVNVNIGTSTFHANLDLEIEKAKIAIKYGTDTIMDLSTGGDLDQIRRTLMDICLVPFGTVPIYQAYIEAVKKYGTAVHMTEDEMFNTIERHLKDGVDFITVHTGITKHLVKKAKERVAGIVSRGGAILAAWMLYNDEENPLYKNYDYLLELASMYDAVLSLGDALRPGSVLDAHDYVQVHELINVAHQVERAWEKDVQVMVEGPGHMPLNRIAVDVRMQKSLCKGAPYYVLGPLVTDIAYGYDHIAAAIGSAIASAEGADLICYLTPAEHLSLPNPEQVKLGLIASKIGAHAGDIVKLGEKALKQDLEVSVARRRLDWKTLDKLALDPKLCRSIRNQYREVDKGPCTMCGDLCVYQILAQK